MSYLMKHAGYRARGAAAGALLGAASGAGLKAYYNKQLGRKWNHNLGGSALTGAAIGGTGGFMIGSGMQRRRNLRMDREARQQREIDEIALRDSARQERHNDLMDRYRSTTPGTEEAGRVSQEMAANMDVNPLVSEADLKQYMEGMDARLDHLESGAEILAEAQDVTRKMMNDAKKALRGGHEYNL